MSLKVCFLMAQFLIVAAAHFLALLSPGPDFFLVIRTSLAAGWRMASGVCLGIALANAIPTAWGLGFAGILALVGVMCSLVSSRMRVVSAGIAGTAAVAAFALPLKLNILVAIAAAVAVCLMLERPTAEKPGDVR